jgi:hypothetical protein
VREMRIKEEYKRVGVQGIGNVLVFKRIGGGIMGVFKKKTCY